MMYKGGYHSIDFSSLGTIEIDTSTNKGSIVVPDSFFKDLKGFLKDVYENKKPFLLTNIKVTYFGSFESNLNCICNGYSKSAYPDKTNINHFLYGITYNFSASSLQFEVSLIRSETMKSSELSVKLKTLS